MTASTRRIVFVLPDLGGGGAQRVMMTLAAHLDRNRFSPMIMALNDTGALADAIPAGVEMETARASRLRHGLPWLARRLRALKPAAAISTLAYSNLALLSLKPILPASTRIMVREANTPDATIATLSQMLPGFISGEGLYRYLYPRAALVIAQSEPIALRLRELAPGIAPHLAILPNPVDVARLRAEAARPLRQPGSGLRLVGVGRLTHQKGFDRLIGYMSSLPPDARLTIYGEGPDRAALTRQIEATGFKQRITLAGFTHQLPACLAGADALVMPSRWEGLPNAALEALAVGTPVIASPEAALTDVAAQAPDAVTIAASDAAFIERLSATTAATATPSGPRKSLLPEQYEVASIVERFQTMLMRTVS